MYRAYVGHGAERDYCAACGIAETDAADPKPEFDANAPPLILAFIPQENPEKLIGDIETITEYLQAELGYPVNGFVSQDHAAAVEALRNGEADISFMGALPYVLAHDQVGAQVILGEVYRGSPIYHGRIFVRRDSGIETLEDLRGSHAVAALFGPAALPAVFPDGKSPGKVSSPQISLFFQKSQSIFRTC